MDWSMGAKLVTSSAWSGTYSIDLEAAANPGARVRPVRDDAAHRE